MMQIALLVSAALTAFLGIAHSGLGEVRLIGPLLAPDSRSGLLAKSAFARNILRFAWHLTSVAWWGLAAILIATALGGPAAGPAVLGATAATLAVSGAIVLVTSRGRHFAWPVFLLAAALALWPVLT
jgi:hypothetical protein